MVIQHKNAFYYLIILLISLCFDACNPKLEERVIGVKIYDHQGSFDELFEEWNRMGINTGFCSQELIFDQDFMKEAKEH